MYQRPRLPIFAIAAYAKKVPRVVRGGWTAQGCACIVFTHQDTSRAVRYHRQSLIVS